MIYLDKNENQYGPSEKCREVLQNITLEMFNSYSRGYPKIITNRLSKEFGVPPENILLGYGAEDLLKQAFYFFMKEGDKILLPLQSWNYYTVIAKEINATRIYYTFIEKNDRFEYDIKQILNLISKEYPKIVLVCSPNNPTGTSINFSDFKKIVEESKKTNSIVILDEAYWGFENNSNKILKLTTEYDNILILRTFSKIYGLAGVRIGFGFIGKGLQNLALFNKRYLGFNRISEELTFAALDSKDYYKRIAKLIKKDKKRYYKLIKKFQDPEIKIYKSDANFILIKLPEKYLKALRKTFEKEGVVVKFYEEEIFKNCIRISIGTVEQNDVVISLINETITKIKKGEEIEWME
jgi:histidinol-phosphate aminotransferase